MVSPSIPIQTRSTAVELPVSDVEGTKYARVRLQQILKEQRGIKRSIVDQVVVRFPWAMNCEYAEMAGLDSIAIAAHGHTGWFHHVLTGSTAEHGVQHVTGPVLTVTTPTPNI